VSIYKAQYQKSHNAPKKSRFANEVGEHYAVTGKLSNAGKLLQRRRGSGGN